MEDNYKDTYGNVTIYKVGKKWRKNHLSFEDGGVTVYVQYEHGYIKEYNNIKYPKEYMNRIDDPKVVKMWIEEK